MTGVDPDAGDVLTYALADDAGGLFAIDAESGEIRVADGAVLDLETLGSAQGIVVTVTDAGGLSYREGFAIELGNVNEGPVDLALTGGSVLENALAGTVVGRVTGVDPDAGDVLTYALADDAGGLFAIDAESGEIRVADGAVLDLETLGSAQGIVVTVTDAGGLSYREGFAIELGNVNEGPVDLALTGGSVLENALAGTVVGRVTGVDPDAGDVLTYALADDAGGLFAIDAESGEIRVADGAVLDLETLGSAQGIVVTVTDAGGLSYREGFAIELGNVNEGPVDLALTGGSVLENALAGTVVGRVTGVDPDAGDVLTYALADDAGGLFAIDAATGEIRVADGAVLDLETLGSAQGIVVTVTDAGGLSYREGFAIELGNVNEGPVDLALTGGSVLENALAGTVVGRVTGVDPDAGDVLTYALADDAGGLFAIDAATGEIRVADGAVLDLETLGSAQGIVVTVTDAGGLSYREGFAIELGNVNEGPVDLALTGGSVLENALAGTVVGRVTGVDPDAGDVLTYALADDAGGLFAIDAESGEIRVADGAVLDLETLGSAQEIVVTVTDAGGLSYREGFAIELGNVNEGPVDLALTGGEVLENALAGTVVGRVTGVDPDAGDVLTYALDAGGLFAIDAGTGEIRVADGAVLVLETRSGGEIGAGRACGAGPGDAGLGAGDRGDGDRRRRSFLPGRLRDRARQRQRGPGRPGADRRFGARTRSPDAGLGVEAGSIVATTS